LLREVDTLKIDAIALGNELAAMRDNISQVDSTGEQIITQLAELDRARRNAHAAANALRETDRWSSLVLGIGELLEAGEMDQIVVPRLPGKAWKRQLPFRADEGIFDDEFIEERRKGLEGFINKVAGHPLAQNERCLHMFLQDKVIDRNYRPCKMRNL
ncbi:Sorting nexin-3, partial [Clonorchis sinensis]